MDCFIKKIWQGRGEEAHYQFVRFGKGKFENRAILNLWRTRKIKLKGSFEWANDFVNFASELGGIKFSGIILTKQKVSELSEFPNKKKIEIIEYNVSEISSEKIQEIKDKVYIMLLDAEEEGVTLKIKRKLPKPSKRGAGKIDEKFCRLEADLKYWPQLKEAFMLPECRKCQISHVFEVNELVFPEGEKDFAKIRERAKRKGKIIRKIEIGKQIKKEEKEFEV